MFCDYELAIGSINPIFKFKLPAQNSSKQPEYILSH